MGILGFLFLNDFFNPVVMRKAFKDFVDNSEEKCLCSVFILVIMGLSWQLRIFLEH